MTNRPRAVRPKKPISHSFEINKENAQIFNYQKKGQ